MLLMLVALVASPVFFGLLIVREFFSAEEPRAATLQAGDRIVYLKQKVSTHPGPRARDIHPSEHGDTYSYLVNKFWVVEDVLRDGRIVVRTRTRKQHYLKPDDPNLRKASLIEQLRFRARFPELLEAA